MLSRRINLLCKKINCNQRLFHNSRQCCAKREHPYLRTFRILKDDVSRVINYDFKGKFAADLDNLYPSHADVVIIGGAAMGSSIAYWLKKKSSRDGLSIVVFEKDPTYSTCSTVLSVGGLRQQFSLPENIQMSLYGAEFLRKLPENLGPEADCYFTPHGYLMLATESKASQLIDNATLQKEIGAINELLSKNQLKQRFPWMNVDDVEVGCLGLENEGWFDPWSLLNVLRKGAIENGTKFINAEVVNFTFQQRLDIHVDGVEDGEYEALDEVIVKLPNGEEKSTKFAICIIAAGHESGAIGRLARIGSGPGMLAFPLPVEKRKRYVFRWDCQGSGPGLNTPMTIDPTGTYFRRDGLGGTFIGGLSPLPSEEPETDNLEVDHKFFDDRVWPNLAKRVPDFESLKVRGAWSGYYDFNYYDENGIIGAHPYYHNLYIAAGFSGHGIQQAPAVGRAISELVLDGDFQTIDLTRFGFDRFIVDKPMLERCIV